MQQAINLERGMSVEVLPGHPKHGGIVGTIRDIFRDNTGWILIVRSQIGDEFFVDPDDVRPLETTAAGG